MKEKMSGETNISQASSFIQQHSSQYHAPVMVKECIEGLHIKPEGIYVDITFGGGGHSKAILEKLTSGKLFVFDQDDDAIKNYELLIGSQPSLADKLIMIQANFRYLKKYLRLHGIQKVDGILGDLGVSSHQFDTPGRGFSFRFVGDLDMRMSQNNELSAGMVINQYSVEDLHRVFGMYGEITNARTLANAIVKERNSKKINTTEELKKIASTLAKRGQENKYLAQVFQALRIEVNDEMKALEEMLPQTAEILNTRGRLVVMTYHSLEDRPVKNYIKHGKLFGEAKKDLFGNVDVPLHSLLRKPIEASAEEIASNPRARSAKLRIAEKN